MNLAISLSGTLLFRRSVFCFPFSASAIWSSVVNLIFSNSTFSDSSNTSSPASGSFSRKSENLSLSTNYGWNESWNGKDLQQFAGAAAAEISGMAGGLYSFPGQAYFQMKNAIAGPQAGSLSFGNRTFSRPFDSDEV